jgi:ubiquinone/menaquinone biosynthesis C-methylase UbiE
MKDWTLMMEAMILSIHGTANYSLINCRAIMAGVTKEQWPQYISEVYRILKPGTGWIMCCEFNPNLKCDDGTVPADAAIFRVFTPISVVDCSSKDISMNFSKYKKNVF